MLIFNFDKFLLNNIYHACNCILTENFFKPYLCSIIQLPNITEVIIFCFSVLKIYFLYVVIFSEILDLDSHP